MTFWEVDENMSKSIALMLCGALSHGSTRTENNVNNWLSKRTPVFFGQSYCFARILGSIFDAPQFMAWHPIQRLQHEVGSTGDT